MIDHGQLFAMSAAALQANAQGVAAYVDDLGRMRAVLGVAPQGFPWWTVSFLAVLLLLWCAGLAAAWRYLSRRAKHHAYAAPAFGSRIGPSHAGLVAPGIKPVPDSGQSPGDTSLNAAARGSRTGAPDHGRRL